MGVFLITSEKFPGDIIHGGHIYLHTRLIRHEDVYCASLGMCACGTQRLCVCTVRTVCCGYDHWKSKGLFALNLFINALVIRRSLFFLSFSFAIKRLYLLDLFLFLAVDRWTDYGLCSSKLHVCFVCISGSLKMSSNIVHMAV